MKLTREEAEKALKISENRRFAVLGYAMSLSELGASPSNDENELAELGRNWFEQSLPRIKKVLCNNMKARTMVNKMDASDDIDLSLVIADIIAAECGGIPALYVSAQLVKKGIKRMCNDIWE